MSAAERPHPGGAHAATTERRYDDAPRRVYWELTRACALACRHCRAEALHERLPDELDTDEAFAVLRSLAAARPAPVVILTGGDPLERPDFAEILAFARSLGLHVDVAPSATPRLSRDAVLALAAAGIGAMSLSLDGATPASHDGIRGIPGCFATTMECARHVAEAGIPLQVNTLVTAATADELGAIHQVVRTMGARRWSLFFLVQTGRGSSLAQLDAERAEEILHWAASLPRDGGPVVSATEAPMFRRVLLQERGLGPDAPVAGGGMRDGNGILFLSYRGDAMPSGFLPMAVGNVRETDVLELYREAPLMRALRRPDGFGGRCGRCEWREACGGSRGRAWASTHDALAEDPLCAWEPAGA